MLWVANFLLPQDCITGPECEMVGKETPYISNPTLNLSLSGFCIILKNQEEFLMLTIQKYSLLLKISSAFIAISYCNPLNSSLLRKYQLILIF